ncbi:hypothetical protein [Devosia sp. YR412]|uniref:hypothetical protein n=1 Tax=Devosia sp. YR412 TaxID=1881030 RepID=UPI000B815BF8|nr:hypothetical protein [Devosia sp. YR412]
MASPLNSLHWSEFAFGRVEVSHPDTVKGFFDNFVMAHIQIAGGQVLTPPSCPKMFAQWSGQIRPKSAEINPLVIKMKRFGLF